jgi:hypothetical protein
MSEALEKIDAGALAALMSPEEIESFNADFSAGVAGEFLPQLSIRGGKFRLKIDGTEEVVGNEIAVHLVASRNCTSKSFYEGSYDPNKDQKGPDCSSADGQYPDSNIQNPVSSNCQLCDNNAWGSRGNGSKGKACSDYKQIVVSLAVAPEMAFGLRIPPTSFKPFAAYIQKLKMANVPAIAATTNLKLGDEEYPTLEFSYAGLVDRTTFDKLKEVSVSAEVQQVVQITPRAEKPALAPAPEAKTAEQPVAVEAEPEKPAETTSSDALNDLLAKNNTAKKTRKKKTTEEVIEESTAEPVAEVKEEPAVQTDGAAKLNALLAKMKG